MKDVARDLGVSVVTISKVLRNHGDISEETRRRVYEKTPEVEQFHDTARNGAALIIDITRLQGGGPKGNFRMQREA